MVVYVWPQIHVIAHHNGLVIDVNKVQKSLFGYLF